MGKNKDWDEGFTPLLGTMTDAKLAKLVGTSPQAVHTVRTTRCIKAFGVGGRKPHQWTKFEKKLLGTITDKEIAGRLGLSEAVVSRERRKSGIAKVSRKQYLEVTPKQKTLLGKAPDITLAKLWGVRVERVTRLRKRLGIPIFQSCGGQKVRDLTGKYFGSKQLIALHPGGKEDEWVLMCRCGNECRADRRNLMNGRVKSCGCLRKKFREYMKMAGKLWVESQNQEGAKP